jgi:hypothetical protein
MNNVILRKVVVTTAWQPLSPSKLVASVTISTPPTNAATVLFRTKGEPAHEVPWVPGEWHDFKRVNLADIEVKGAANDLVSVTGGTW